MSKTSRYRQCVVTRKHRQALQLANGEQTNSVESVLVTYLPERFARKHKVVRLRAPDGSWQDGWRVTWVGESSYEEAGLPNPHQEIKRHTQETGDQLPRRRS